MEQLKTTEEYREYWYRWVILTLFVLIGATDGLVTTSCSPITKEVAAIYDVPVIAVQMNMMVSEFVFIIAIFPANYITDTFEIRVSVSATQMNCAAVLTIIGSILRMGAVWSFWLLPTGNVFMTLGLTLLCGCTAKISAFWFRPAWVCPT